MSQVRLHLLAALGFGLLAILLTWPLSLHLSTSLPGSPGGDTGVYVWNIWVFRHELMDGRLPFYTSSILAMTNTPVNLSLHNYTTFANVLALPLLPWLGVVATFNVIYIFNVALAGYAMFLLARNVTGRRAESWLAGLLFAASPFLIARGTAHYSLVAAAPLPLFALFLRRTVMQHRMSDAAAAGLTIAWASFCDAYYGVYCLLMAAITFVSHALRVRLASGSPAPSRLALVRALNILVLIVGGFIVGMLIRGGGREPVVLLGMRIRMQTLYTPMLILSILVIVRMVAAWRPRVSLGELAFSRRWLQVGAVGLAAMLLPMAPVLYAFGERMFDGAGSGQQPAIYWRSSPPGVDLLAYFMPNPNHPLWGAPFHDMIIQWSGRMDAFEERTAALPLIGLAVILFAWRRGGWKPAPLLVGATISYALMSLGPFINIAGYNTHIPGPWALLRYVPVLGMARSPSRIAVLTVLCFSLLFAVALKHLTDRYPHRRRLLLSTVGVLLLFELLPAPRKLYSADVPAIYRIVAANPDQRLRVLELPVGVRDGASSIGNFSGLSQYYQTMHGKALVGGYISRVSQQRKTFYQRLPMMNALMILSEGRPLPPEVAQQAEERADAFLVRARLGYVVVEREHTSPELLAFATRVLGLKKIAEDSRRDLYVPRQPIVEDPIVPLPPAPAPAPASLDGTR